MDMTTTEITTTARRIQRELHSRHRSCSLPVHITFDADGNVTGRVYGQNVSLTGMGDPGDSLWRSGRYTLHDIQRRLDARAAAAAIGRSELGDDLDDWWGINDENDWPRISADDFAKITDLTDAELEAEWTKPADTPGC